MENENGYDSSEELVRRLTDFFKAMHDWEESCEQAFLRVLRGEITASDSTAIGLAALSDIFREFCTGKPKRGVTYGKPRQYDPSDEYVIEIRRQSPTVCILVTERKHGFRDGYAYKFVRQNGRWLIERRLAKNHKGEMEETLL